MHLPQHWIPAPGVPRYWNTCTAFAQYHRNDTLIPELSIIWVLGELNSYIIQQGSLGTIELGKELHCLGETAKGTGTFA